jgi:hypothetical protein
MTPHLPPDDPDDDEHDPRVQTQRIYYRTQRENRNEKTTANFRTILDSLLVLGVVAIVGVVWNMSVTMSAMTMQLHYMSDAIAQLQGRIK